MSRSQSIIRWFALSILSGILLTGCLADDGDQGETGPAGQPAVRTVDSATALTTTITSVTLPDGTGKPVVNFTMANQDGIPVVGVSNVRFTIAKLIPEDSAGNSSEWQSYVNSGNGQATNERNGTLVDNNNGTYTYTFNNDITVTEPSLTHRVGIQIGAVDDGLVTLPTANGVYTWRPSNGATTGIPARDIVVTESCNECHGTLALHGGGRIDTRYCVTCHNPGTVDPDSGNTVDFKVMIHKIHRGADLPSVVAGEEYVIFGFRNSRHDYSDVHFPQDIRGCAKCHDETDTTNTPQAVNWQARPTKEACGSCHDDINFDADVDGVPNAWNRAHPGDPQSDNSACANCHQATGTGGQATSVAEAHRDFVREATAEYGFEITAITSATGGTKKVTPGEAPIVTFRALNPVDDSNYVLATEAGWPSGSITLRAAWSTTDYTNDDTAASALQPQSQSFTIAGSTPNADGTYTVTFADPIPATATGSGVITIEGRAREDLDGNGSVDTIPVKAAVAYFGITDATAVARRDIVDIDNCDQCHEQLSMHGDNRTDEPQLCVTCHNGNMTDVSRRSALTDLPETPDVDESVPVDGKAEESIDFKTMIHAIHGSSIRENGVVIYGFTRANPVGAGNPFIAADQIHFPGVLSNCRTCHLDGTYELPLGSGVTPTTISTQGNTADASLHLKITATAAVCSSCHDGVLAQAHMEQNGALFGENLATIAGTIETCAICHGPGRQADVEVVHGID